MNNFWSSSGFKRIRLEANDDDSSSASDEVQVQEDTGTSLDNTVTPCSLTASIDLSKSKTDKPMQPVIKYPASKFRSTNRSFQSRWYEQYPWLEYSASLDAAFCFACRFFIISTPDPTFTSVGFRDWKHATGQNGILSRHAIGKVHTNAMATWKEFEVRSKTGESIGCQLDRMGSKVIVDNRNYVSAVMEAILYCAQQGIALRGHDESQDSLNPGNFRALMALLSRHSPEVSHRLQEYSSNATWLSPSFQNEIIRFFAMKVLGFIKQELQEAKYFTLLADETKDIGKHEQLSIVFRYVYKCKTVERFTGYCLAKEWNAEALTSYITNKMKELELKNEHLVSQCYDGASVMSGCNAGVQKLIKQKCPQAIYIHCCAHRLNLVLVDVAKRVKAAADFFSLSQAVYVFLSASKSHELFLSNQKSSGGREIRLKKLSDTRWSCRIDSITAILSTFSAVLKTLEDTIEGNDHDRAIQARGILSGIQSFNFVVALLVYKKVFSISAKLSDVLQSQSLSLATAADLIQSTIDTFKELRSDSNWDLLWQEIEAFAKHHNIQMQSTSRPQRRRCTPSSLDNYFLTSDTIGTSTVSESASSQTYKLSVYFPTLDVILSEMNERFSTSNLLLMKGIDALSPRSANFLSITEMEPFLQHYSEYVPQLDNLENEVILFQNYLSRNPISNPEETGLHNLLELIEPVKAAFPLLHECVHISLTLGTSTATVECSFSSLRRIKTYLRSTMAQQRLDSLALLYIERDVSSRLWGSLQHLVVEFAQTHKNSKIVLL